eukprot:759335-Hanusia_phi.AAC.1
MDGADEIPQCTAFVKAINLRDGEKKIRYFHTGAHGQLGYNTDAMSLALGMTMSGLSQGQARSSHRFAHLQ